MKMNSERSNKGKGKLVEGDDHCPPQNNLPGSDNQQQNFGGGRGTTEAAIPATADGASSSHSASEKKRRPLCDFVDQINPHRLQWPDKLHKHFVHAIEELVRCGKKVTPKTLTKEMAINGITQQQVKSHLQRHREGRITERNWQVPRGPRLKNNKAGKIDGPKSASKSASTSRREHDRNGPGMGVGGNLETGTVTTPLYSAQQQHQVDVADISAANGVCFMTLNVQVGQQELTPDFQAQCLLPAQNGVGLQILTLGFQDHNGLFYPFQLGNYNHCVQLAQYCAGLQVQTPGFQDQNGVFYPFLPENGNHWVQLTRYCGALGNNQADIVQAQNGIYNFQPGNELARMVQPTQYGVGIQEHTPDLQYQNGVYNFQPGNELACMVQPAQYNVGLQEKTPGLQYQHGVYNFQPGNELARMVQPAEDGGALGNQPPAVQAQNVTAIMPDNVVTTGDQLEDFSNLYSLEQVIADFDFSEPFGLAGQPL